MWTFSQSSGLPTAEGLRRVTQNFPERLSPGLGWRTSQCVKAPHILCGCKCTSHVGTQVTTHACLAHPPPAPGERRRTAISRKQGTWSEAYYIIACPFTLSHVCLRLRVAFCFLLKNEKSMLKVCQPGLLTLVGMSLIGPEPSKAETYLGPPPVLRRTPPS